MMTMGMFTNDLQMSTIRHTANKQYDNVISNQPQEWKKDSSLKCEQDMDKSIMINTEDTDCEHEPEGFNSRG
jgi:hypothetical protein